MIAKKSFLQEEIQCEFFKVKASVFDAQKQKYVSGIGHICVLIEKIKTDKYRIAASFKSPLDPKNMVRGLNIAAGRLFYNKSNSKKMEMEKPRNFIITSSKCEKDMLFKKALKTILDKKCQVRRRDKIVERTYVPDWLANAVMGKQPISSLKFSS